MGKQIRTNDDMEIDEIRNRLTQQDKTLSDILIAIRGSLATDTNGLIQKVRELKESMDQLISDVAHLQRWKKMTQDSKGKVVISVGVFFTRVLAAIGGLGTIVAIVLALKELAEK